MAAYAALFSLAKLLEQILDHHHHRVFLHEKEKIKTLHENTVFLLTFLDDNPGEASNLEARITIAANEAEDIIQYHILNECGVPCNWKRLYDELEMKIEEIQSVVDEATLSSKNRDLMSSNSSGSSSSRLSPQENDVVVGFEEDLTEIRNRLCNEPHKLQIIPIVGMGGIGKTTLARYAHQHPSSMHQFDIRAWVTVSQNYHVHSILLRLLNSIDASTEGQYASSHAESLVLRVYQYLKGRRYLIVVDDIWNANVWDDISRVFPDDSNGSRIIITTRDLDVASSVNSSNNPHAMRLMDADQSWRLLKEKVFGREVCPPQLEKIGKKIAENCRGLPLAIVVIAGVLSKVNQMEDTWETVAKNVTEAVNTSDEPFAEILAYSYKSLPHHLRPCFLYMGGFPEDYEINASKLIRLWVAEGFPKSNGSKDLEEAADDYLEDLAKRSLVLINKKRYNGMIKTVKMHDLLRDLCLKRARDEKFLHVINEFSGSYAAGVEDARRLSTSSDIPDHYSNMDGSRVHTILIFRFKAFDSWRSFKLLRVVDAMSVRLKSFPDEIGELLHLRYLALTFKPDEESRYEVPESWSKLQNLQTLVICYFESDSTSCLPYGIWRMPQLRNVIMSNGFLLDPYAETWRILNLRDFIMSDGFLPDPCPETRGQILVLEHLHTLKRLSGFKFSKKVMDLIPNLKKLGIVYWFWDIYETEWSEYGLNNLVHLQKLEKLNFHAHPQDYTRNNLSHNISFPVTLKKLTLSGSGIPWEDMSVVGSLPNLEVLKLKRYACHGSEWETNEDEFCQLKVLVIDSTDPQCWITESSHFPRLESLILRKCETLIQIPDCIGEIPTLQLIEVDRCNLSVVESAKYIEDEQRSYGNDLRVNIGVRRKR